MSLNNFIFSKRFIYRSPRHVVFWLTIFAWHFIGLASINFTGDLDIRTDLTVAEAIRRLGVINFSTTSKYILKDFITLVPYCYLFAYWFVPRLLPGRRYLLFAFWLILLTLVNHIAMLYSWGLRWQMPLNEMLLMLWYSTISFVNISAPIVCGLFIAIKMLKVWYVEEQEKLILSRENANAELQLLKAQINPHFLFNTLNNIYSFALSRSQKASEIISRLHAILEYMTTDCDDALVSAGKEIKMIEDYVGLEKVRYGERLNLEMTLEKDNQKDKLIPPFLLIPFVENSFKHGASEELLHPWIKLNICVKDNHLCFRLINSKPEGVKDLPSKKGLGLRNVEKRLSLLFPGRDNLLAIINDEKFFEVNMRLPLIHVAEVHTVARFEGLLKGARTHITDSRRQYLA